MKYRNHGSISIGKYCVKLSDNKIITIHAAVRFIILHLSLCRESWWYLHLWSQCYLQYPVSQLHKANLVAKKKCLERNVAFSLRASWQHHNGSLLLFCVFRGIWIIKGPGYIQYYGGLPWIIKLRSTSPNVQFSRDVTLYVVVHWSVKCLKNIVKASFANLSSNYQLPNYPIILPT